MIDLISFLALTALFIFFLKKFRSGLLFLSANPDFKPIISWKLPFIVLTLFFIVQYGLISVIKNEVQISLFLVRLYLNRASLGDYALVSVILFNLMAFLFFSLRFLRNYLKEHLKEILRFIPFLLMLFFICNLYATVGHLFLTAALKKIFSQWAWPEQSQQSITHVLQNLRGLSLFFVCLNVGVIIPILEELAFRRILYGYLRRIIPLFFAFFISLGVFTILHYEKKLSIASLPILFGIFTHGYALTLLYEKSTLLALPILYHILLNGSSTLYYLYVK